MWLESFHKLMQKSVPKQLSLGAGFMGDGFGFISTKAEEKAAESTTIASGVINGVLSIIGVLDDIGDIENQSVEKVSLNLVQHFLDSTAGGADIVTGTMGHRAIAEESGDKRNFTRKKGIAQIVSGGAGGLSGLMSAVSGIVGLAKYRKGGAAANTNSEDAKNKRREALASLIKGLGKFCNGVVTGIQAIYMLNHLDNPSGGIWGILRKCSSFTQLLSGAPDLYNYYSEEIDIGG